MSSFWLITTYFNPLNWSNRRRNYDTFRRHLGANLLTVEWSPSGQFQLGDGDADRLIQIRGGDLMWQKERLINIGLSHLPDDCAWTGWIDCDLLFRDPLWSDKTIALLQQHDVVQLYGEVHYLDPGLPNAAHPIEADLPSHAQRPSIIAAWQAAEDPIHYLAQDLQMREAFTHEGIYVPNHKDTSPGFAWAARRSWLMAMGGLPDRAIVGSGDMHSAYALLGCLDAYTTMMRKHGLGAYISDHSHRWACQTRASDTRIAHLDGTILHLYHGDLADRHYLQRQFTLMQSGFLPDHHLELDPRGAWRFNDAAPPGIRELMARYFVSRREDGNLTKTQTARTTG